MKNVSKRARSDAMTSKAGSCVRPTPTAAPSPAATAARLAHQRRNQAAAGRLRRPRCRRRDRAVDAVWNVLPCPRRRRARPRRSHDRADLSIRVGALDRIGNRRSSRRPRVQRSGRFKVKRDPSRRSTAICSYCGDSPSTSRARPVIGRSAPARRRGLDAVLRRVDLQRLLAPVSPANLAPPTGAARSGPAERAAPRR